MRGADRLPRGIVCDGGFKLLGTPLAFSGAKSPGLLFYSHLDQPLPRSTKRIIGTSFLMSAVRARKHQMDMLAVDYDRLFRLGRMDLRLLPAGLGPGSAMLEIRFEGRKILYCGGLRVAKPLSGEAVAAPRCDLLLLDASPTLGRLVAPRTVRREFLEWVAARERRQVASAVVCDSRAAVYDVVSSVGRLPVPVHAHRSTYEMLRDTGYLGVGPDHILRLERSWPTGGLVLFSRRAWTSMREKVPGDVCFIGAPRNGEVSFGFGLGEGPRGLLAFARSTGATAVALGPRCGEAVAEVFQRAGFNAISSKRPVQLPLAL